MSNSPKTTPLMKQYNQIKSQYPDAILLFRVGDFYETFGQDAVIASKVLGIVLTQRNNSTQNNELAGFPHHSLPTYLPRLVKAGHRVAICDQLEDPKQTKTIVRRGVTELVTPGVAFNDDILQAQSNNFLACLWWEKHQGGISLLDVSTGEFLTSQGDLTHLDKILQNFRPSEILLSKPQKKEFIQHFGNDFQLFLLEDWVYKADYAHQKLLEQFQTHSLKGFGIEQLHLSIITAGAILHYLEQTQHHRLEHINTIQRIAQEDYVWLDKFTIRNLELHSGQTPESITLLNVIDNTLSPMGSRTLKRWLALPLKDKEKIEQRHQIIQSLMQTPLLLEQISEQLKQVNDLERLISKVATAKIYPREMVQLKKSLQAITPIKTLLDDCPDPYLHLFGDKINPCHNLINHIDEVLFDDAPVNILKGNVIKKGYCTELDELRSLSESGRSYLNELLQRETQQTQIPSLKIDNNNVFGFYFEVRNTHKDKVPAHWIRKQTLVNAERYITPELKEYESKILGAQEKITQLEQQHYAKLIQWVSQYITQVQQNASFIGQIDCLCGFTHLAIKHHYVRPQINEDFTLNISQGRHPVIEQQLPEEVPYIANDVFLDRQTQQIVMITGPNMSGKSAILRQTALIVLLAQIGSFVPASSAQIGIVDKIFTRVGASDNISQGESTFMVEMNESALILNNISERSLILLDEIGRGTSTYDGISIAWAIAEYLHQHPTRPKTLFATHYHELNEMTHSFERIKNFNVSVEEQKNKVLFLRKLVPGGSQHSFGIHVAKMAGMPQYVIEKANTILKKLEQSHQSQNNKEQLKDTQKQGYQLSLFSMNDPELEQIKTQIQELDLNHLTPIEALMKLNEWKKMIL